MVVGLGGGSRGWGFLGKFKRHVAKTLAASFYRLISVKGGSRIPLTI